MKKIGIIIGALLLIGLVVFIASPGKPRPGDSLSDLGNQHILALDEKHEPYNSVPPTSGPHLPRRTPWGVSSGQVPDEIQVQNLEEGGVVISYDPSRVATTTVEAMGLFMKGYPTGVLMQPYSKPPLPAPIVLTAWTRLLNMETFDETLVTQFINAYKGIDHHKQ